MALVIGAALVLLSAAPALSIGDDQEQHVTGGGNLSDGQLAAEIDRDTNAKGHSRAKGYHYELEYRDRRRAACPDGVIEVVTRVYDDGLRETVYIGCPRFRNRRPVPPSAAQVK